MATNPPRHDSNQCRLPPPHNISQAFFPTAHAPDNRPPVQRTIFETLKRLLARGATIAAGFLLGYCAFWLATHTGVIGKLCVCL